MNEEDAPSLDASRGSHSQSGTRLATHTHTGLPLVLTLTLCRLDREADFRGGVFFGLNVFPKRGIFGLTKERSMGAEHVRGTNSGVSDFRLLP